MAEPAKRRDPMRDELADALRRLGLVRANEPLQAERLAGGVSSDIWKVTLASGPVCVKRALSRLKVAQDWRAPVERNLFEVAYIEVAGELVPEAMPRLIAADPEAKLFVMEYLEPSRYPVWKEQLAHGLVSLETAEAVARRLAAIHRGTAGRSDIARRFPTDAIFQAIRLEPYLLATAARHPDLAPALEAAAEATAATRLALVHGDVSPKNILVGPQGPVLLDAECAWYGDPAFDLAFCLNHLLLKCLWRPGSSEAYLAAFRALAAAYLGLVRWEEPRALEDRAARLLPGLLLARVDGKSPVEYIAREPDRERVRRAASPLLRRPVSRLGEIADAWAGALAPGPPSP